MLTAQEDPLPIPALPLPDVEMDEGESAAAPPLLTLDLSEEPPSAPDGSGDAARPAGEPTPLSAERIRSLLARLPAPAGVEDVPAAGSREEPPSESPVAVGAGADDPPSAPEALVRTVVPEGSTDFAPHVTIVFSEAMVGPAAASAPTEDSPPARLDPSPPGDWRWLDARTLRFQPEAGRLPGGTSFTVTVPPGTATASGQAGAEEVRTSFRTAGPRAIGGHPAEDPSELQPVILLAFDQHVDPAEVLASARLVSAVGSPELSAVPLAEIAGRPRYAEAAEEAGEGRWVALRPDEPLPAGEEVRLLLAAGLRSEEGPLPQERSQELRFRTRDALRVVETSCGGADEPCEAFADWSIRFTNPLDPAGLEGAGPGAATAAAAGGSGTGASVRVEPDVPGFRAFYFRDELRLQGVFEPFTTYRVHLPAALTDVFGQSLGRDETVEVRFGPARPFLRLPGAPFVALDAAGPPRIEVPSRGAASLEVELYRVGVEHWPAFAGIPAMGVRTRGPPLPDRMPGERVLHERIVPGSSDGGDEGWYHRTPVDLSPALVDGLGHAILVVRATSADGEPIGVEAAWIQVSALGLTVVSDHAALVARAWAAGDGAPLEGVRLELPASGRAASTDEDGLARLPLAADDSMLVARRGADTAILPPGPRSSRWAGWSRDESRPRPLWYTMTDRGLYRPGEEAWVHGWLRTPASSDDEPALRAPTGIDSLLVSLGSSRGGQVGLGSARLSPDGRFHGRMLLPDDARTGRAQLYVVPVKKGEADSYHGTRAPLEIAEFRRPEYEVTVEAAPGPHVARGSFAARVEARYFDGPALPRAPVEWRARTSLAEWRPPGWDGWHVGPGPRTRSEARRETGETVFGGHTGADGVHALRVGADEPRRPFPVQLELEAEVRDLDRRVGVASRGRVIHPAGVLAALRTERRWLALGEETEVIVAVADLEGRPAEGAVPEVRAERIGAENEPSEPLACERVRRQVHGMEEAELSVCAFRPGDPGVHRIVAEVADASGARSRSEVEVRVIGPRIGILPRSPLSTGVVEILPDRERYAPGDTARVLVESSIGEGRGLAVLQRFGIRRTIPFELRDGSALVPIPLRQGEAGSYRLAVEVTGGAGAPAVQRSTEWLVVSGEEHRLLVEVHPRQEAVEPGDSVTVELQATDEAGRPVEGGVATVWAVDEAVLGIADYELPDPIEQFYGCCGGLSARWMSLHDHLVRPRQSAPGAITARLLDARSGEVLRRAQVWVPELELQTTSGTDGELRLEGVGPGTYTIGISDGGRLLLEREVRVGEDGLDMGVLLLAPLARKGSLQMDSLRMAASGARGQASLSAARRMERGLGYAIAAPPVDGPEVRRDFAPLAAFVPDVVLDGEGRAVARLRLPDTMTRYRIFALVSRGAEQFGRGEGTVTARRDVVVRATPPRFMHPGDRAEVPVTVQNASDSDVEVEVAARAGRLALEAPTGWRIPLRAGERREVRVPVEAQASGEGEVEVLAITMPENGEAAADALGVTVPVRPPEGALRVGAVHERLVDSDSASLPIDLPAGALKGRGELVITASTSLLHGISEAVRMLCREPLPWPEVTAPRLLALAGGIHVVEALRPEGVPAPEELREQMATDVEILLDVFVAGRTLDPFTAIQATHALLLAQGAGAEVPEFQLLRIARDLEGRLAELGDELPAAGASEAARLAYALHVASGLDLEANVARDVALRWTRSVRLEDLPAEALGWLLRPVAGEEASGEILRILSNRAVRSTAGATLGQGAVTDAGWTASYRTTDAIVLAALLEGGHEGDARARVLADDLTRSLLAHRDGATRWASAFESSWGVLALGMAYGREAAAGPADLVVTGQLAGKGGEDRIGRTRLGDGAASALEWRVPVDEAGELHVRTEGNGTLHLRAELRYAEASEDLPPVDRGFSVARTYEAVDDPDDVVRAPDGSWRIRAGARVRVRLTVTTPVRRHRVELRDPLAGGFEPVQWGHTRDPEGAPTARMPAPAPTETGGRLPWLIAPTADWTERVFRARIAAGLPWHTHREVADGRVDAYTAFLPAGSFETTHLVRAVVPGTYRVAPPRVEEVSHPETSGAGTSDRVVVEVRGGR